MLWLGTPGRGRLHLILDRQKLSKARPFSFWPLQIIVSNWVSNKNKNFTWIRVNNEKFSHHEDKGDTFWRFHSARIKPLFDKRETLFEEIRILRTNLRKDFWPFWSNSWNTLNILVTVNSKNILSWSASNVTAYLSNNALKYLRIVSSTLVPFQIARHFFTNFDAVGFIFWFEWTKADSKISINTKSSRSP